MRVAAWATTPSNSPPPQGRVSAVCSTSNVDLVTSLGAQTVVDYTRTDLAGYVSSFEVILDCVGTLSPRTSRRLLATGGTLVAGSGPKRSKLLGPIGHFARCKLSYLGRGRRAVVFTASTSADDLVRLVESLLSREIRSAVGGSRPWRVEPAQRT